IAASASVAPPRYSETPTKSGSPDATRLHASSAKAAGASDVSVNSPTMMKSGARRTICLRPPGRSPFWRELPPVWLRNMRRAAPQQQVRYPTASAFSPRRQHKPTMTAGPGSNAPRNRSRGARGPDRLAEAGGPMSWKSHIDELRARERLAEQMGGEERVARQRSQGKLTVRERIAFLADPGSFHEVGKIAGKAGYGPGEEVAEFLPATMVFGRATLDGRPAVILGDDFTVRGGASDASIAGKML